MPNPWQVVEDFERGLCEYTGAKYAVAVSSCTAALQLACEWNFEQDIGTAAIVEIPKHTYVSVPCAIANAGGTPEFLDVQWSGCYQLLPYPIWDCALRFTSGMYVAGDFQCVSFAAAKILGMEQGGAILHDTDAADLWLRRMRYDGRTPGKEVADEDIDLIGYHFPMIPSVAAQGLLRLAHLPKHNQDQVREYPDISKMRAFR